MDRRSFFKTVTSKVTSSAVKVADSHVNRRASQWIRPPYALQELDFLLTCTRCDLCIEACPHDVIFSLPSRLGAGVMGTPAMDLLNKGCHLCEDWPCVHACEPNALVFPQKSSGDLEPLPVMARADVNKQACLPYLGPECGACEGSCPVPGALKWEMTKPFIDPELCTGCGLCRQACIVDPSAVIIYSLYRSEDSESTAL